MKRQSQGVLEPTPGPSREYLHLGLFDGRNRSTSTKLRRLARMSQRDRDSFSQASWSSCDSSEDSESSFEMDSNEHEERRKLYRKLRRDNRRLRQENSSILNWKSLQMLAERDNFRNHLREAMMTANSLTNNSHAVENAGVLMAIEEFGLQQRLNPLLQFYGLDPDTSDLSSNVSGVSCHSTDSDVTDSISSSSTNISNDSRKRIKFLHVAGEGKIEEAPETFNFEDFAVDAAINNKGLSL